LKSIRHEAPACDPHQVGRFLKTVKVCYGASKYSSHARVARTYRELIRRECEVLKEIEHADIVVLHFEPHCLESLFETYPELKSKYVIGYCVWEASELPVAHQKGISLVQEVWTCSRYCSEIFARYHPQVTYVPHVVERGTSCSDNDREHIRRLVSYNRENFYFLMLTKLWDLRKNTATLLAAFQSQRASMPKSRLIIKVGPQDSADCLSQDGVTILREHLNEAQVNALYEIADAYVSPHHSEGWGLTIADAMIFQKPTIATGYSGNCEFMNAENSLLLDFTVNHIKPEDCFSYFDQSMKWAYPSQEDLEQKLLFLYHMRGSPALQQMTQHAARDIARFDRNVVSQIIKQRIAQIVDSERFSQTVAKG
jgi:glycosyltransferase involved in cell wall biosynthesis